MKTGVNNLAQICDWFKSLNIDAQMNILNYINNKSDVLNISSEEQHNLNILFDNITTLIIDLDDKQKNIINTLSEHGLEEVFAIEFYNFCKSFAEPYLAAKIINEMTKKNLQTLCSFVINHFILYEDYYEFPFKEFMSQIGLKNDKNKASQSLQFIRSHYFDISNRKYSLSSLQNKLLKNFLISPSKVDIIITQLNDHLPELYQAHLIHQIDKLLNITSSISKPAIDD